MSNAIFDEVSKIFQTGTIPPNLNETLFTPYVSVKELTVLVPLDPLVCVISYIR